MGRDGSRRVLLLVGLGVCAVVGVLELAAWRPGAPSPPLLREESGRRLRLIVLMGVALGLVLARRRPAIGGAVSAIAAAGAAALYSFALSPGLAAAIGVALAASPAITIATLPDVRRRTAAALLVGAVALVGAVQTWAGHRFLYGPTHPASPIPGPPGGVVRWIWAGGVADGRAEIIARLREDAGPASLTLSVDGIGVRLRRTGSLVRFSLDRVPAARTIDYAVRAGGTSEDRSGVGRFRTPPRGPSSFEIAVSSCARTGSNGTVFDAIRARDPLLYINTGDLFYADIERNDVRRFRAAFDRALTRPAQANLYRSTAIAYMWDDHDFGTNDSDSTSPSAPAAHAAYRELAPHVPLALPGATAPLAQSFVIGRVRIVMSDTRSARTPHGRLDGPRKTMLGDAQRRWLEREFLEARDRGQAIVWVSPVAWIGQPRDGDDGWAGYATERRRIAEFIRANRITALVMVSGDTHATAIDDGTNSGLSPGERGFPVLHAGALDRPARDVGGPFSVGVVPGGGQFGTIRVQDRGGPRLTITLAGHDWRGRQTIALPVSLELPVPSRRSST